MLRAYGPDCDGSPVDPSQRAIPDGATWIDLESPTREEEQLVERCIGLNVPTQEEMAEIEPSSRLFERNGALYMTLSALRGVVESRPTTTPISFVFNGQKLVTVRYATPKPIVAFTEHVAREPELRRVASTVLVRLLDAITDRRADELGTLGSEIELVSNQIFEKSADERRIPAKRLPALLTRLGRAQTLLAKIRYSAVSTSRMLSFLSGSNRLRGEAEADARNHLSSLMTDSASLSEHSSFLSDNLIFLLD